MAVNLDKPTLWEADTAKSINLYNDWFMRFAPPAFRAERTKTAGEVKTMFDATNSLQNLTPAVLKNTPKLIFPLRMATCPPIARDRLVGLADVNKNLVEKMEEGEFPSRMSPRNLDLQLEHICETLTSLLDTDLLPWLGAGKPPDREARDRSESVIGDRLCGAYADPIIRNAQEERQLHKISTWLTARGYEKRPAHDAEKHPKTMPVGTFAIRMIVRSGAKQDVNIPIDVVIQPNKPRPGGLPILIEAKSAGDFTNVNKRRKEESDKMDHLKARFGDEVPYVLFLCGYFNSSYLKYEAAEGIDWVWEHRIDDLADLGL